MTHDRLADLLDRWEDLRAEGLTISAEDLCRDAPELLVRVTEAIEQLLAIDQFLDLSSAEAPVAVQVAPRWPTVEHYVITGQLGSGAMGRVFSAHDRRTGELVAIKTIRGDARLLELNRLRHEFRTLSQLSHPRLVALYELIADGTDELLVMEHIDGVPLLAYWEQLWQSFTVARGTVSLAQCDPPWDALRSIVLQITEGLDYLHRAGFLHRDLKPSNVMIDRSHQVVLLDYGLVAPWHPTVDRARSAHRHAGTRGYMSPEQQSGQELTPASDWYGLGCLLRYLIELRASTHRALDGHAIPHDLAALTNALLVPDPRSRPSAPEIVATMTRSADVRTKCSVALPNPVRFVGRASEWQRLQQAYGAFDNGSSCEVHIEGIAGIGKTTLVERFVEHVANNAICLRLRCYEREFTQGTALNGLIEQIVELADREHREQAQAIIMPAASSLLQLFPSLRELPGNIATTGDSEIVLDRGSCTEQSLTAIGQLLRLCTDRQRLLLVLDDIQWIDNDSLQQLRQVLRRGQPRLLLIASYRPTSASQVQGSAPTAWLGDADAMAREFMRLPGLSLDESHELAGDYLQGEVAVAGRAWVDQAEGHPLMLRELCHFAQEYGWGSVAELSAEGRWHAMISERRNRLSDDALRILETVTLAGAPLPESAIVRACGAPTKARRIIRALQADRWIRSLPGPTDEVLLANYHDLQRSSIERMVSDEQRLTSHRQIAHVLRDTNYHDLTLRAHHCEAAGEYHEACALYRQSGEHEAKRFAYERAASLLNKALQLAEQLSLDATPTRKLLATVMFEAGRPAEFAPKCLALAATVSPVERLDLTARAVALLIRGGRLVEAHQVALQLFGELQIDLPRRAWIARLRFLTNFMRIQRCRLDLVHAVRTDVTAEERIRMWACAFIGAYLCMTDGVRGPWLVTYGFRQALRVGDATAILLGGATHLAILAYAGKPFHRRRVELMGQLEQLKRTVDDPILSAGVDFAVGLHHLTQGEWQAATQRYDHALTLLRAESGNVQANSGQIRFFLTWSTFCAGELKRLLQSVPDWLRDADDRGDRYVACMLRGYYGNIRWLVADKVEDARREIERAQDDWSAAGIQLQHVYAMLAATNIDIYRGQGIEAWRRVTLGRQLMTNSGASAIQFLSLEYHQFRGRAALAAFAITRQSHYLSELERSCRVLRRAREHWTNAWVMAFETCRRVLQDQGSRIDPCCQEASQAFAVAAMPLHRAALLWSLRHRLGPDWQSALDGAHAELLERGVTQPDRFAAMMFPCRVRSSCEN